MFFWIQWGWNGPKHLNASCIEVLKSFNFSFYLWYQDTAFDLWYQYRHSYMSTGYGKIWFGYGSQCQDTDFAQNWTKLDPWPKQKLPSKILEWISDHLMNPNFNRNFLIFFFRKINVPKGKKRRGGEVEQGVPFTNDWRRPKLIAAMTGDDHRLLSFPLLQV